MQNSDYDISLAELDANSPRSPQPSELHIPLLQHQLAMLHRCRELENSYITIPNDIGGGGRMRTRMGVIADMVGAGKSFVVLALIHANRALEPEDTISTIGMNTAVIVRTMDYRTVIKSTLLVIPHNLVTQWDDYIRKCCPNIKYIFIRRQRDITQLTEENIADFDLIVVTNTFYNRLEIRVRNWHKQFRRVVYDEIDNMNLPNCEQMKTLFTWFVTASYGNILYPSGKRCYDEILQTYVQYAHGCVNNGFIKSVFDSLSYHKLRRYTKLLFVRNKDEFVAASFNLPSVNYRHVLCWSPAQLNLLVGIVEQSMINAINAGDIEAAVSLVNPQNRNSETNLVHILLTKYRVRCTNLETRILQLEDIVFETPEEKQAELTLFTKRLDELRARMSNIQDRIAAGTYCNICYEPITQNHAKTIVPCCSNSYCFKCINTWLLTAQQHSCPMCKAELHYDELLVVDEKAVRAITNEDIQAIADTSELVHENNNKLNNLENILKQSRGQGRKYLIFSTYDRTLNNIHLVLQRLGIHYSYLMGNQHQIITQIASYKTGNVDVLLVNPENYGSGLNLENTTDIIIFHRLDNEIEKQVIGRAQRCGRTCPLNVWYLLHANEIRTSNNIQST